MVVVALKHLGFPSPPVEVVYKILANIEGGDDATHRWRRSYLDSRLSKTLCSTNESSEASNVDAAAPHTATAAPPPSRRRLKSCIDYLCM